MHYPAGGATGHYHGDRRVRIVDYNTCHIL
jgi:hypothetical protein